MEAHSADKVIIDELEKLTREEKVIWFKNVRSTETEYYTTIADVRVTYTIVDNGVRKFHIPGVIKREDDAVWALGDAIVIQLGMQETYQTKEAQQRRIKFLQQLKKL